MVVGSMGENGGKRQGVWDGHVHIHAVFKMNSEQGPTVQCREFCSMYAPAWMRGEAGGEWKHVCMAESLWCPPETITTLLIGYIPKQNKKFKKIIIIFTWWSLKLLFFLSTDIRQSAQGAIKPEKASYRSWPEAEESMRRQTGLGIQLDSELQIFLLTGWSCPSTAFWVSFGKWGKQQFSCWLMWV